MKKLLLFVAVATLGLTTSCSSDDDGGGNGGSSELKVTIDGVQKTFNTIVVDKETFTDVGGDSWIELTVTATINNDPSEMITFYVDEGDTGAYAIWSFDYTKNGVNYSTWQGGSTFSSVVQTNSNGKLKGTFTGSLLGDWSNENQEYTTIQTTNGSFNISY